jgi:uncharacterized protein YoxC
MVMSYSEIAILLIAVAIIVLVVFMIPCLVKLYKLMKSLIQVSDNLNTTISGN